MPDFTLRSDSVDVEQIMGQIRARLRQKRGVDYTEEQVRELAEVKLERFLDPRSVRSDLLEHFRRMQQASPAPPNYAFEEHTLYDSNRSPVRWVRRLLNPVLKLFFNPNPLIQALHIQGKLNTLHAERASGTGQLYYELLHNLVVEATRTSIEIKNLKMQVESLASQVAFNERRARSLERVVAYRPEAVQDEGGDPTERPPRATGRRRPHRERERRAGAQPAETPPDQPRDSRGPDTSR
jgi:hypothetical protein